MLKDNLGRHFRYLRLSITDVCNFKCNYCLPNGYQCDAPKQFLTLREIQTLLYAFAQLGMKKIRLTGGEPTLRRDLTEIIALCRNTPGIEHVAMTTNGYRLARHIDDYVAAGLQSVNISIDSLNPESFIAITGYQKFEQVMLGIERASASELQQVKLNAVLLKQFNTAQFEHTLEWLRNRRLTYRFIELMETGNNSEFFSANHCSGQQVKQQLLDKGWQRVLAGPLSGPAQEFYHPDYAGRVGLIMPYSKDFCQNCNRLRVSSMGQLQMCLFADAGIDLRNALQAEDVEQTKLYILAAMQDKVSAHQLSAHQTGATLNLAQIGG
ncbi:GTP 3',8-cyclase MoaA [Alteromonas flava]|uniref:GTP 3',8-cyclase MoaA n=1 Tax=Alteromonas flava TaxID=2048003 RepID=UPI000C2902EF|nr:GTP 3',8-cyclase MoaA [Alteromonas flava]